MLGRRTDGGADVADFLKYENDEPEFETYTPSGARKSGERVIEHARRRNRVYDTVENNEGRARERVHDSVPEVKSTPRSVSEAAERSPKAKSRKRGIGKTLLTIALSAGLAVGGTLYISDQINARKENKEPEGPETKIEEQGLAPSLENNIAVEDETILYGENGADSFVLRLRHRRLLRRRRQRLRLCQRLLQRRFITTMSMLGLVRRRSIMVRILILAPPMRRLLHRRLCRRWGRQPSKIKSCLNNRQCLGVGKCQRKF